MGPLASPPLPRDHRLWYFGWPWALRKGLIVGYYKFYYYGINANKNLLAHGPITLTKTFDSWIPFANIVIIMKSWSLFKLLDPWIKFSSYCKALSTRRHNKMDTCTSYTYMLHIFQMNYDNNLWNVVSSFLHYSMEPGQDKQRLRPDGWITAADELRAPRVIRSLKIFLDSWWSLRQ